MRVYLDNAATSFPKPTAVYDAVDNYQRNLGVAVGRGAYRDAIQVQRMVDDCRVAASQLFRAEGLDRIVFTYSGTDGLNLALQGICRPGDHVITTTLEHNSVLRPLRWMKDQRGLDVTVLHPEIDGQISVDNVRKSLRPETRLVAIQYASNVTGLIQPVDALCSVAKESGVLTLVDAAQAAGHVDINLTSSLIDVLACPGHKGLLGPLGTGLVYIRRNVERLIDCYRLGGTGTHSDDDLQPESMPDRFEAGNHNAPGLAGLSAALSYLRQQTVAEIRHQELELTGQLVDGLRSLNSVTVYGHNGGLPHTGVVSFNIAGLEAHETAGILDETFGIQARAGLHCAPGVHRVLGTFDQGGTVRFSLGSFTTDSDIQAAVSAVKELSAG